MVIKLKMGGSNPGGIGLIVMIVHVQNREVTLNFITCQYSKGDISKFMKLNNTVVPLWTLVLLRNIIYKV